MYELRAAGTVGGPSAVPDPCQNGRRPTVASGHPRTGHARHTVRTVLEQDRLLVEFADRFGLAAQDILVNGRAITIPTLLSAYAG